MWPLSRFLVLSVSLLLAPQALSADDAKFDLADAEQKWFGTIQTGGPKLRLLVEVTKGDDGSFSAKAFSLDQGNAEIPIGKFEINDGKLKMDVPAVKGSFEGDLNDEGTSAKGTWTQMGAAMPLTLQRVTAVPTQTIKEAWIGTLDAGVQLKVQFRIVEGDDGKEHVLFDSLTQSVNGLDAKVHAEDNHVTFKVPMLKASFEGDYNEDKSVLEGTWKQGTQELPLRLKRSAKADDGQGAAKRPQHPKAPFPYEVETVTFENPGADVTLAGTLTFPQGEGPFPAVALVSGSGPQDRDEAIMGHKPFLVIADHLSRQGIAVLRYDDRGVGESTGDFTTGTSIDFAGDAAAAIAYLKQDARCDPDRLGIIGHSEGALIAGMLAAKNPDLAHVVMLAGPGVPGDEIIISQTKAIFEASHMTGNEEQFATLMLALDDVLSAATQGEAPEALEEAIDVYVEAATADDDDDSKEQAIAMARLQAAQFATPWFKYFLSYDPAADLRKAMCPVLAMNGSKDLQVLVDLNLPKIEDALKAAGLDDYKCVRLDGLNHLFQTAETGTPLEYAAIEETFSPEALEMISAWVLSH